MPVMPAMQVMDRGSQSLQLAAWVASSSSSVKIIIIIMGKWENGKIEDHDLGIRLGRPAYDLPY